MHLHLLQGKHCSHSQFNHAAPRPVGLQSRCFEDSKQLNSHRKGRSAASLATLWIFAIEDVTNMSPFRFQRCRLSDFYKAKGLQITKDQKQHFCLGQGRPMGLPEHTDSWLMLQKYDSKHHSKTGYQQTNQSSRGAKSAWVHECCQPLALWPPSAYFNCWDLWIEWFWVVVQSWYVYIYKYVQIYLWISTVVFATMYALTSKPHLASPLLSLETHKYHFHRVINMSTESTPFIYYLELWPGAQTGWNRPLPF